ncbi:MAG: response regulator [Minwuia sp.]|uniref:response regulator n=1 Tax=Minwuia sp. TaxID=2493630 RepID=UPI003A87DD1C
MTTAADRFLSVDDNPDSADLAARVATRCGFEARAECNPAAVPQLVQEWQPDIVSLDLCMPEIDGVELLTKLIKCGFSGEIIFISGQTDRMVQLAGKLAEAHGLSVLAEMTKPIEVARLRDLLNVARDRMAAPCQATGT